MTKEHCEQSGFHAGIVSDGMGYYSSCVCFVLMDTFQANMRNVVHDILNVEPLKLYDLI